MLRADTAPDILNMLLMSMVVTKATTSSFSVGPTDRFKRYTASGLLTAGRSPHALVGRNKFDLQILDARLREVDDA